MKKYKKASKYRLGIDRVEFAFTSFTKALQTLATADFIEVKVPQIYFHRTFTTFTKTHLVAGCRSKNRLFQKSLLVRDDLFYLRQPATKPKVLYFSGF